MKRAWAAGVILFLGYGRVSAMSWTGFGSVTLSRGGSGASELTRQGAFGLDPLVLHIHENVSDRSDFMAELALDHAAGGGTVLDAERYQIGYRRSDLLGVTAGRMHNILGYWNTAYHHGTFLQTTVARPGFLRFEDDGGVLPLHIVGAAASGRAEFARGLLKYDAMAGNGPRLAGVGAAGAQLVPGNTSGDGRAGRAAAFKLVFEPEALPGAGVGVSGDVGQERGYSAAAADLQVARIRQDVYAAELYYVGERPEFLAEVYRFQDKGLGGPVVGPSRGATAYYVQFSYGLGKDGAWRPYARQEALTRRDDDALFSVLGFQPYHSWIAGVKWTMAARSALKLEWRWRHQPGAEFDEEEAQWSFSF
ncbi:MAG: hypothetical protein KGJ84_00730 [Elusimicrobia bacterium]|nr:hypothetical protein [Elusimicrobiota bacterium]